MAADWNIDVGFNASELKSATKGAGATGGAPSSGGGFGGFAKAIKAGLMATGIIGLLLNLRVVLDTIAFLVGIVSSILGLLILQVLNFIVPFFKDPFRSQIKLGLFIVNGIITGLEFMTNALLSVLSAGTVGGFGENALEFPKFQEEIIIEAYDNMQQAASDFSRGGDTTFAEMTSAAIAYAQSFKSSFITESEFDEIKAIAKENNTSLKSTLDAVKLEGEELGSTMLNTLDAVAGDVVVGLDAVAFLFREMEKRANRITDRESNTFNVTEPIISTRNQLKNPADLIRENFNKEFGFNGSDGG